MLKLYISTLALASIVSAKPDKDPKNPFAYSCVDSTKYHDVALNSEFTCNDDMTCLCSHYRLSDNSWSCIAGENPCGKSPTIPRYPTSSFQGNRWIEWIVGMVFCVIYSQTVTVYILCVNTLTDPSYLVPKVPCWGVWMMDRPF